MKFNAYIYIFEYFKTHIILKHRLRQYMSINVSPTSRPVLREEFRFHRGTIKENRPRQHDLFILLLDIRCR